MATQNEKQLAELLRDTSSCLVTIVSMLHNVPSYAGFPRTLDSRVSALHGDVCALARNINAEPLTD